MAAPHSPDADGSLTGATRTAVLAALRRAGEPLTVQRIAGELGLHSNTVRFHLARLVRARLVFEEQAERSGPGRPHLLYRAAPSADETSGDGYRFLAVKLPAFVVDGQHFASVEIAHKAVSEAVQGRAEL